MLNWLLGLPEIMGYLFGLLLLSTVAVQRQVKGETTGFAMKHEDTETLQAGFQPVFDEPIYPVGGPMSPEYLPNKPNILQQHFDHPPQGLKLPQLKWYLRFPPKDPQKLVAPQHQKQHQGPMLSQPQQQHQSSLPRGPMGSQPQQLHHSPLPQQLMGSQPQQRHHSPLPRGLMGSQPQQRHQSSLPRGLMGSQPQQRHHGPLPQQLMGSQPQQQHHGPMPQGPIVLQSQQWQNGPMSQGPMGSQHPHHHQGRPPQGSKMPQLQQEQPHALSGSQTQELHHGCPPQGRFMNQNLQQRSDNPPQDQLILEHQPKRGDLPPQGRLWRQQHHVVPTSPTAQQYHGYPTIMSQHHASLPQDPQQQSHNYGVLPQEPNVLKQQYLDYITHVTREPGVSKQNGQYSSYALQQPVTPKQHHSYTHQGPKYPQQNTYATKSPQRKRYIGKRQKEMIKLPQKPHIAINRPGLFHRRHY